MSQYVFHGDDSKYEFDPNFEYHVYKQGTLYVAGVKDASFDSIPHIFGDLFSDRVIDRKREWRWRPKIWNPLRFVPEDVLIRVNEITLEEVLLTCETFEKFAEALNKKVKNKYERELPIEEIDLFFKKAYGHFKVISDR